MTYDASRITDARIPVSVVELYLDDCAESYGVSPCTASSAAGGECYNTYATCQDITNFNKASKTYRFYQSVSNWPIGETGFPCVKGQPKFTPCQIDPKGSLGRRGVVTITLKDFADDDLYTDPYATTRTYNPETQGSFFGKLKARSKYYKGRLMKVRQGYINTPFSWSDFQDRLYIIDSIDVDLDGKVTLIGKDLLKLAENTRAVAPTVSTGTLSASITASATSLVLQSGEGADYATSGYVRIGKEVIQYTGRSSDTLTGLTRGSNGSTADEHDADDGVQQCLEYSSANVVDIIEGLLKDYAGIDEAYIPYDAGLAVPTGTDDEWDIEKASWLSGNDLTHLITKPTGINKLIENVCKQNLIYMWFDERDQEIKLRAIAPQIKNELPPTLTDDGNIINGSIKSKDNTKGRISQVWVYYDIVDITESHTKPENYKKLKVDVDTESEGSNAYDEKAILVIYADWLGSANAGLIITLAGRLLSRYSGTPHITTFKLDTKDADIWTGNTALLDTNAFQGSDGSNKLQKIQVLKVTDDHDHQLITIEAESWNYGIARYGFVAPNSMGDYLTESAANQDAYGFICTDAGLMSNGDQGYYIA